MTVNITEWEDTQLINPSGTTESKEGNGNYRSLDFKSCLR